MKPFPKLSCVLILLFISLTAKTVLAQTAADIFDPKVPVTWLGLDYTQAKFIPDQRDVNKPEVTNNDLVHKYIPAWNYLFMIQPKKFDVAKAIHHPSVINSINVTEVVNNGITTDFFSTKQSDFNHITEQTVNDLVKNYDYKGNTGIGLIFFVEAMDREIETESILIAFVNMNTKTVLFTAREKAKTGGMGFRNNWADATYKIMVTMFDDFYTWQKQTTK